MKLEIVSHCWRYSRLLRYQLSSLYLYPPEKTEVLITIYCADPTLDPATDGVLSSFLELTPPKMITMNTRRLETKRLFRRSIGRNLAARETTADWIWFTDCDMLFRSQAIDALAVKVADVSDNLVFPQTILIHKNHATGDAAILKAETASGLIDIDESEFVEQNYRRAIGGVQIVSGAAARRIGYCPEKRWQRPAQRWQRAREDVIFRKQLGSPGRPLDIPNVFRMRHSQCGREIDVDL